MKTVSLRTQKILLFIPVVNFSIPFIWFFINGKADEQRNKKTFMAFAVNIFMVTPIGMLGSIVLTQNGLLFEVLGGILGYFTMVMMFVPYVYMQR